MQSLVFFLGIVSLVQILFLPGYIMLKLFRLRESIIVTIAMTVALSLLGNYVLVVFLVSTHNYHPVVLRSIVSAEIIVVLGLLLYPSANWASLKYLRQHWCCMWQSWRQDKTYMAGRYALVTLALACVLGFVIYWGHVVGSIFTAWDPVMSYNNWAVQWAAGHVPSGTWHYPQLFPANWSMSYVLIGHLNGSVNLQVFPKAIMPLFAVLILLLIIELALHERSPGLWLAVTLCAFLFVKLVNKDLGQGWMDVPMTSFSFLAIVMWMRGAPQYYWRRWLWLSALVCATAAVTKQAGLYVALLYPVVVATVFLPTVQAKRREKIGHLLASWMLLLIIVLPWYVYIEWQVLYHHAPSEIGYITSRQYLNDHMTGTLRYVLLPLFLIGSIIPFILFILSWLYVHQRNQWRFIFWLVTLPNVIIWVIFFSYSLRNLTLTIPLIACAAGLELWRACTDNGWLIRLWHKAKRLFYQLHPIMVLLSILIVALVLSFLPGQSGQQLNQSQLKRQQKLGDATLNWKLYEYQRQHGFRGKILTDWDYLGHVPNLEQYYQAYRPSDSVEGTPFQSANMIHPHELIPTLQRYPASYLLIVDNEELASKRFLHYIKWLQIQKIIQPLFTLPHKTLYLIKGKLLPQP